jgi:hypothetical protein
LEKKTKTDIVKLKKKVLDSTKVPVAEMTEAKIYPVGCPERTDYVSVCFLTSNSIHFVLL